MLAGRAAGLEGVDQQLEPRKLCDRRAVAAAGRSHDAFDAALGLLEVGEDQLGLDRLDVGERIDAALRVDHVVVGVGANDVEDRVGLADVREELVAETLARGGAGDEAGDVVEVDGVVDELTRAERLGDPLEALVDDGYDSDVRLDRRERVVGGLSARLRERVEKRGLAGVRHPDDPDLHCRGPSTAGRGALPPTSRPSRAPASTSDGWWTPSRSREAARPSASAYSAGGGPPARA